MATTPPIRFSVTPEGLRFVDEEALRIRSTRSGVVKMALALFPDAQPRPERTPRSEVLQVRVHPDDLGVLKRLDATYSDVLAGALADYAEFRIRNAAK